MKLLKKLQHNFVKYSIYYISVIAAILVAGAILVSVIGFKAGFDYAGGTVSEVVVASDLDVKENYNDTLEIIERVMDEKTVEIASVQIEETAWGNALAVKTLNGKLSNAEVATLQENIKDALFTEFGYDSTDSEYNIQKRYVSVYSVEETASQISTNASIAIAVAMTVLLLGVFFRYGLSSMFTILISSIVNMLLVMGFVLCTRITVNIPFVASIITVFVLTVISQLVYFDKVRENYKSETFKGASREQLANVSVIQSFKVVALILLIALVGIVLVTGLGITPVREFGLPTIFGVVISALSTIYVAPTLYTYINFGKQVKK